MSSAVPGEETVHDCAREVHFVADGRVGVQGVVVAIKAVKERGFGGQLEFVGCSGGFAGWWIVDGVFLAYSLILV